MRTYGAEGLRAYIRHHLDLQRQFLELLEADDRFELTAPPRFGLTCFAIRVRLGRRSGGFAQPGMQYVTQLRHRN